MFFFGGLQAVVALGWWSSDIAARYLGTHAPHAWTVPSMWAHAWLLLYGLFPFFIFGFLMTAGPNWLSAPRPSRIGYVPAAFGMAGGLAVFYTGLFVAREIAAAGLLLHLAGWLWGVGTLVRIAVRYWNANARYAVLLFAFLTAGAAGSGVFTFGVATGNHAYTTHTLHGAVWFFLLPIFSGVSTRMVPFFSSRLLGPAADYRPMWARPILIGLVMAHGAIELAGAPALLWLVDLPLAVLVACLAWKWGIARSFSVRLLAVLHISVAVLALALLAYALLSAALAIGAIARVGLGPLHLLTIGYFAAMTLGMVSRVSLGHSGRALEADDWTWRCYVAVLAAALLRLAAEVSLGTAMAGPLMAAAAFVMFGSFAAWACR